MGKQKRKWTNNEVEALHAGVKKHGAGKWTLILSDSQFASSFDNRSNVDLKDKWRNLTRRAIRERSNNSEKVTNPRRCKHPPPHSSKKRRRKVDEEEELVVFKDYHKPRITTRLRRGAHRNTVNQARKLDSKEVQSYIENLWLSFPEDKKSSFTHLDPLWYTWYSCDSNKQKVLSWIKKKDIFSRKYVIFPIVQWGHWFLLIFCHFGESLGSELRTPCILLLDSLAKADHSKRLEPAIRKFVLDIYSYFERTEDKSLVRKMPFLVPKVPQQRDNAECGFLVLYYIKLFVESAPESFSITDGYPYFMKKDWFSYQGLDSFCKTLDFTCVDP
ncbi:putative transcription factor MYB-related family [Helianthus annuus]|nr:putative transcription factor MYB-related family [Helianthus annuus]